MNRLRTLSRQGPPPPGQDLRLNRAVLTDQRSAYVGRFARGWLRLPERRSPVNHRPGREPGPEYRWRSCAVDLTNVVSPSRRSKARSDIARAAVSTETSEAPARTSASAHAAAVAPVVNTSSTSTTRDGGTERAANDPPIAFRRSSPLRRACGPASAARRSSGTTTSPIFGPTACARALAWSNPRVAFLHRESGTHVIASASRSHACAIAAPSASATGRQPANFSRWTARRTGPSNRNGARAARSGSGGQ